MYYKFTMVAWDQNSTEWKETGCSYFRADTITGVLEETQGGKTASVLFVGAGHVVVKETPNQIFEKLGVQVTPVASPLA